MRKAALALDVGNTAANDLDNRFRNFLVMLADDDNLLFVIKADREGIAGFGHNEEGQQRIQHRLDAEIGNAGQQEADIKNKACRADSHRIMLLDNRADDIRAAARAAHAIHAGRADAVQHAARDTRQQLVMHNIIRRQEMEKVQRYGKNYHAVQRANHIALVHILIGKEEKRHVADKRRRAHRQSGDIIGQHRNAADTAAEHFVRQIEGIHGNTHNCARERHHKILMDFLFHFGTHDKSTPLCSLFTLRLL